MAVRQVAAVREVHSQHGVAGLQRRHIDGDVRLRAGVRLHVGVLGAEKRLRAIDGELLGLIHEFAAAVVALAGIAFGVFVREDRAHRFEHRFGNEILRGDQLEAGGLPADFVAEDSGDLRIGFLERTAHPAKFRRVLDHRCAHLSKSSEALRAAKRAGASRGQHGILWRLGCVAAVCFQAFGPAAKFRLWRLGTVARNGGHTVSAAAVLSFISSSFRGPRPPTPVDLPPSP